MYNVRNIIDNQEALLAGIRQGDEKLLHQLYLQYRDKFLRWVMGQYRCNESDASETYQKAFTILYFNIKDGKVAELTSTLETYLYGIGKNVFRERFKDKHAKTQDIDERFDLRDNGDNVDEVEAKQHRKTVVQRLLKAIGEPCRSILKLYYFKRFSMESVAENVGYKNEKVAKKKKYQCLQSLRKKVDAMPELKGKIF